VRIDFEDHVEKGRVGNQVADVTGTYKRCQCRQTTNQGALWIREQESDNQPPLFLMLKPEVSRTGPDISIVSRSLSHKDESAIVAVLPSDWQPCDAVRLEYWQFFGHNCLFPASSNLTLEHLYCAARTYKGAGETSLLQRLVGVDANAVFGS
jgi:hypothetical protein